MGWFNKKENQEEKIQKYIDLIKECQEIVRQGDELAYDFQLNKSMIHDLEKVSLEEKEQRISRYNEFITHHKREVQMLLKSKMKCEREMAKMRNDNDSLEAFDDYYQAKQLYKSKQIGAEAFDEIILKAKKVVPFSDALTHDYSGRLLILHRLDKNGEDGKWCIPGGHVDMGEDYETAAKRELQEETGLRAGAKVRKAGTYDSDNAHIEYYHVFLDEDKPEVILDSTEHDGYQWVEIDKIDEYDFIFDMKDNIKKILGIPMEDKKLEVEILAKALKEGKITPDFFRDAISKAKNKTYFSDKERKDLAKEGEAMPNGKYPIRNAQDLHDAIKLVGASDMPKSEVKAWIKKRAKDLGLEDELPDTWRDKNDVEKSIKIKSPGLEVESVAGGNMSVTNYGEFKFSYSDGDGHADKFADFLATLQEVCSARIPFSITLKTKDAGEQEWKWKGNFGVYSVTKTDDIRKSFDQEAEGEKGFGLKMCFTDLDEANLFKSMVEDYQKEGKLKITSIDEFGMGEVVAKAKDKTKVLFRDYLNFIEGAKTRLKNIHWSEEDNAKHVYLDDLLEDVSEFEDKFAEAAQAGFGRFKDGEITGEDIDINEPVEMVDLLFKRTEELRAEIEEDLDYSGEISWIDDFLASLKQSKYRLQMH